MDQEATVSYVHLHQVMAIAILVSFFEMSSIDIPAVSEDNRARNLPIGNAVAVYIRNCVFLL